MAYVVYSARAEQHLIDLAADRGADDTVLDRLAAVLEQIAEFPVSRTEPAKLPYPPNRLMANFELTDGDGQLWRFGVTLRRTTDEDGIYVLTINGGAIAD